MFIHLGNSTKTSSFYRHLSSSSNQIPRACFNYKDYYIYVNTSTSKSFDTQLPNLEAVALWSYIAEDVLSYHYYESAQVYICRMLAEGRLDSVQLWCDYGHAARPSSLKLLTYLDKFLRPVREKGRLGWPRLKLRRAKLSATRSDGLAAVESVDFLGGCDDRFTKGK
jgi:hypothetical protein